MVKREKRDLEDLKAHRYLRSIFPKKLSLHLVNTIFTISVGRVSTENQDRKDYLVPLVLREIEATLVCRELKEFVDHLVPLVLLDRLELLDQPACPDLWANPVLQAHLVLPDRPESLASYRRT